MTTPVLNPRVLLTKIKKIEKKQAKRFPHLIERLERIEQRLNVLENIQNATNYNDTEMDYSGAFESDIIEDDAVNNPPHYNKGGIECIDAIEAMLTHEEFIGYLRGNSLKYRWRFKYKNGIQDLEKAEWYENKLMETLKENGTN